MRVAIFFLVLFSIISHAEVYKWVDDKGRVHYSDEKPANETIQVETMDVSAINIDEQGHVVQKQIDAKKEAEAAAAAEARKKKKPSKPKPAPEALANAEVEIYTAPWCGYCKIAIAYLNEMGVPYQEYDIDADRESALRLKQLNKGGGIPFAIINGQNVKGWSEAAYARALGL